MKKKRSTETKPTTPRLENLRLADLIPHPDQNKSFKRHGAFERAELTNDIKANGVKHPPEVLPPDNAAGLPAYTIVCGHTRRDILMELGHTTAEVMVRYDLIDATLATVKKLFLTDNGARRQQTRFDQARYAVELYQVEREEKGKRPASDPLGQEDLRDRIGKIIGVSGRTFQRYANVLRAPAEVQDAFESSRIKLVDAARVVMLSKEDQERLASRLGDGEDPKVVFADFFPPKGHGHVKPNDAVAAFARMLETAAADLAGRVDEVKSGPVRAHEATLRKGKKLIRRLLAKLDSSAESPAGVTASQKGAQVQARAGKPK